MKLNKYITAFLFFCIFFISCEKSTQQEVFVPNYTVINSEMDTDQLKLYYSVGVPDSYSPDSAPVPLILALHFGGPTTPVYGEVFLRELIIPAFNTFTAILVAPVTPVEGSWANQTSEQAVLTLLDSIKYTYNVDTAKVLVTGYSLGAMGSWYLSVRHPAIFTAVIPISGLPPSGIQPAALAIPAFVIHSRDDEIFSFEEVEQMVADLQSRGINIELKVVEGVTHYNTRGFIQPLAESVPWLHNIWEE